MHFKKVIDFVFFGFFFQGVPKLKCFTVNSNENAKVGKLYISFIIENLDLWRCYYLISI